MFLFSLLLSACGSDSGGTSQVTDGAVGDAAPEPVSIQPELDTDSAVSQMITQTGGVLTTLGNGGVVYTLTFPANALTEAAEITMTPVKALDGLDFVSQYLAGVQLEPSGLVFAKPATLRIQLPEAVNESSGDELISLGWQGTGNNLHMQPARNENGTLTYAITHFSGVGAAKGNATQAAASLAGASGLEAKYNNSMAAQAVLLQVNICGTSCDSSEEMENYNAAYFKMIQEQGERWLQEVEAITANASSSDNHLQNAENELLTWHSTLSMLLCGTAFVCDDFTKPFSESRLETARTGIASGVLAAFERASQVNDDFRVMALIAHAQSLGTEYYPVFIRLLGLTYGDSLDDAFRKRYGTRLLIEVINFPPDFIKGGTGTDISIQLNHYSRSGIQPIAFASVDITAGGIGCGRVDGSRGTVSYTTDASGRVSNITISASENCFEPFDKVQISVSVDDAAVAAVTGNNMFYLGRTEEYTANALEPGSPNPVDPVVISLGGGITNAYAGAGARVEKLIGSTPSKPYVTDEQRVTSGESVSLSASAADSAIGGGTASASASLSGSLSYDDSNPLIITLDGSMSANASSSYSIPDTDSYIAEAGAGADWKAIQAFTIENGPMQYSLAVSSSGPDMVIVALRSALGGPAVNSIIDSGATNGILQPGSYQIESETISGGSSRGTSFNSYPNGGTFANGSYSSSLSYTLTLTPP